MHTCKSTAYTEVAASAANAYLNPRVQSLYGLLQDCQLTHLLHSLWMVPATGLSVMTEGEGEG